jgi:DNA-binding NarL/FixJ family response regulator
VTSGHARETVPSSGLEDDPGDGPQASNGMTIVLIAQESLTRHGLSRSFQEGLPDLRIVAVAKLADLLDAAPSLRSMDLIVFTIGSRSVSNPEVLGQITWLRQRMPHVPLVLLMERDDLHEIVEAMAQGVRGFITTSMELSEVGAAIQCVAAGGTFVPAGILVRFVQDRQKPSDDGPSEHQNGVFKSLTPRELEILALLRQGKPNKIIAHELDISENTVKVFVRRIFSKLRVANRTELAVLARTWPPGAEPDGADQR